MATIVSPLLKLAGLLIKVIAKPVAQKLKTATTKRPWLKRKFVSLGQAAHIITTRINVYASGYKFMGVKPLAEEEALTKSTEFVSDFLIYSSAASIVLIEFVRSERKNDEKAEKAAQKEAEEKRKLEERFYELETFVMDIEDVLPPQSQTKLNVIRKKRLEGQSSVTVDSPNPEVTVDAIIGQVVRAIKFW